MSDKKLLSRRFLDESSSDDEDDELIFSATQILQSESKRAKKSGGSVPGHLYIYRDREGGHARMYQDHL